MLAVLARHASHEHWPQLKAFHLAVKAQEIQCCSLGFMNRGMMTNGKVGANLKH